MPSSDITDLVRRFVEDRDGLQDHEYAQLAEAIKQSPDLALQLRDQLVMDEFLSQRLAIDRRQFDAQVQQRIADHLRGEAELNQQADELRSLAMARLEIARAEPPTSWSTVIAWGTALVLLLAIGVGLWSWQQSQTATLVATVAEVSGQVIVKRNPRGSDFTAEAGQVLQPEDGLVVADEASISLTWSDGTRVQLGGGTHITLPATTAGKRVEIAVGDLAASVAVQPTGRPMVFSTPHADAIVRGTELYLHVATGNTRLDVAEGKVELVEHVTGDMQLVQASESATASAGVNVAKSDVRWPTSPDGIVYLFSRGRPALLSRNVSLLHASGLEPRDAGAQLNAEGEWELRGGWLEDAAAGASIVRQIRNANAMSLELVFAPSPPADERPRTIMAFADVERNWLLQQAGKELLLQTATGKSVSIATLSEFDKLTHLAITYRGEQLRHQVHLFLDGRMTRELSWEDFLPVGESRVVLGGAEPQARWQGRIAGLAIYDRALEEAEIERNVARATPE